MTQLSTTRLQLARVQFGIDIKLTEAIRRADIMAENDGSNMSVVRTKDFSICIYNECKMKFAQDEILELIYSTDKGFLYQPAS